MKYHFLAFLILIISCNSTAQKDYSIDRLPKIIIKNDFVTSINGINLEKYEIEAEDLELYLQEVEEFKEAHLLCLAADECDVALLKKLLDRGNDPNIKCDGDDVITNVAFCNENPVELTKLLLEKGADINGSDQDNDSFLSYAISWDNFELVDFLLTKEIYKSQKDETLGCFPIHSCQSVEMLQKLQKANFEVNVVCDNGRNLLHFIDVKQQTN